ncbi:MAG: hypothetical protein U5K30_05810 [Acidimicrobiales bacterium]|nr:hypothetical protein [Acidimicrobiales bacterium]
MALSDRQHHDAYEALTEAFADRTDLVIEMLRTDHAHLATKSDLDPVRGGIDEVRLDVAGVRHDVETLQTEVTGIRHDVETLQTEVTGIRHDVATTLHSEMGHLEVRLLAEVDRRVHDAFAAQTRTLMIGLVMAFVLTALTNVLTVTLG